MTTIPFQRRKSLKNDIIMFFKLHPRKHFSMNRIKKWLNNEMKYNYNQKEIVTILLELVNEEKINYIPKSSAGWLYKYNHGVIG